MGSIRLWSAGIAVLLVLVTGACSKKDDAADSDATANASESSDSSNSGLDPCATGPALNQTPYMHKRRKAAQAR